MGSHSDFDALIHLKILSDMAKSMEEVSAREQKRLLESLERGAVDMSHRGENVITAGVDGEEVLFEICSHGILMRRLPDDPDRVLRISIGCPEWAGEQAYFVMRGDPQRILSLLTKSAEALREALE